MSSFSTPASAAPRRKLRVATSSAERSSTRSIVTGLVIRRGSGSSEMTESSTLEGGAEHASAIAMVVTVTPVDGDADGGCCSTGSAGVRGGWLGPALLVRRQRAYGHAQPALGGFGRIAGSKLFVIELADLDFELARATLAPDLKPGGLSGAHGGNDRRQFVRGANILAVDGENHVTGFEPGFGCGTVLFHRSD